MVAMMMLGALGCNDNGVKRRKTAVQTDRLAAPETEAVRPHCSEGLQQRRRRRGGVVAAFAGLARGPAILAVSITVETLPHYRGHLYR